MNWQKIRRRYPAVVVVLIITLGMGIRLRDPAVIATSVCGLFGSYVFLSSNVGRRRQ